MKLVLPFLLSFSIAPAHAAQLEQTPMARVAQLLMSMRARIESDGKLEQMSYDKYACWCEETTARKARDISEAKDTMKALQAKIIKLEGELGSHGAEIKQLEKDILANLASQREAKGVRETENSDYESEKTESEQCIGALEAAIKVLTGAGEKKAFLETMKEVQLLSVAAGVRQSLRRSRVLKSLTQKDIQLIHHFIEHPMDYVGRRAGGGLTAVQVAHNPFGDYAPQSTQIQGILRGMYEAFTADLERDNAAEAEAQKEFEALMQTKENELKTLRATLAAQQSDDAKKTLTMAESNEVLDDTKAQLAADEEFFQTTKAGCKKKAVQWSIRTSLRTEELVGVNKAISILTSPEALKVFQSSTTTFVQLSSDTHKGGRTGTHNAGKTRLGASSKLAHLAQQFRSLNIAKLALQVRSSGHFDKVIASIDNMIAALRKEEQEDIEHRDRCQRATDKNANDVDDINDAITKAGEEISSLEAEDRKLDGEVSTLESAIANTRKEMKDLLSMRNTAVAEFEQALKDDAAAAALLEQTLVALARFYKKNRIEMALLARANPEYTIDKDKAPETTWADEKYGGRSSETEGIVAIIEMIKEDVEKEMETSRKDNAAAEQQYQEERGALQDTLNAQLSLKTATEKELGEVRATTRDTKEFKSAKNGDLQAENKLSTAITSDCSWVTSHFDSRRTKRKAEIDGLTDAKGYLAGAEAGSLI